MDGRKIGYWAATGLFTLAYFGSGTADLLHASRVVTTLGHLGYPEYLSNLLGFWKLAAVATLLAPRLRLVKEWAYAGIAFELSGGAMSHLLRGDPLPFPLIPVVLLSLAVTSYVLRPASRRLQWVEDAEEGVPAANSARPLAT